MDFDPNVNYLEHYGKKGMRWGQTTRSSGSGGGVTKSVAVVRKSLVSKAVKKRQDIRDNRATMKYNNNRKSSTDQKTIDPLLKRPARTLTNNQLKTINERQQKINKFRAQNPTTRDKINKEIKIVVGGSAGIVAMKAIKYLSKPGKIQELAESKHFKRGMRAVKLSNKTGVGKGVTEQLMFPGMSNF